MLASELCLVSLLMISLHSLLAGVYCLVLNDVRRGAGPADELSPPFVFPPCARNSATHGVEFGLVQFMLACCGGVDCCGHCQLHSLYVIKAS